MRVRLYVNSGSGKDQYYSYVSGNNCLRVLPNKYLITAGCRWPVFSPVQRHSSRLVDSRQLVR